MTEQRGATAPASQTLSRGIRILEILSDAPTPLTIDETAGQLQVHRSNAYRLLRTLEHHGLVTRDGQGRFTLGVRLAALAAGVAHDLQAEARPELTAAANHLGITCFLVGLNHKECVTLVSVEPRHTVASVAQRPGTRHPVTMGAPGKAILMQLAEDQWPEDAPPGLHKEVAASRSRGYTVSYNEVIRNLSAIAIALPLQGHAPAAIGAVYVACPFDEVEIADRLTTAAQAITNALGG